MAGFDRRTGDLGNIVELGHVNLTVPDQGLATDFYISALGLTRDPYMMTGTDNMWANAGRTQFHLPTRDPAQVLRGTVGLIVPDVGKLKERLARAPQSLHGTKFAFAVEEGTLVVTCPWGNRIRCHQATTEGPPLGISYVEFDVPAGACAGIGAFYRDVIGARVVADATDDLVSVEAGDGQHLIFVEIDAPVPDYDGHHVQITVADFSGPHARLEERGLITREDDPNQYRFIDIVDPRDGRVLFGVEHEVRSMRHPQYARALVNRNPDQTNRAYRRGADALAV
ncbi:MAG TPA: VOC family protein [Acidisphaera sp.]|nr:VOC family protein [Acidisphaera sp.]